MEMKKPRRSATFALRINWLQFYFTKEMKDMKEEWMKMLVGGFFLHQKF